MIQVRRHHKLLTPLCLTAITPCKEFSSGMKLVGRQFAVQHNRCFSLQDHYSIVVAVNDGSGQLEDFGLFRGQQKGVTAPSVQGVSLPDAG